MTRILTFAAMLLFAAFTNTTFAQAVTNTATTVSFDLSVEESDCPEVPANGSGSYQLDLEYFDMNTGTWVNFYNLTVSVTAGTMCFTIDAGSVTPAVDFPPDEFINTIGHIVLKQGSFTYILYWDRYFLNCIPLGLHLNAWKPFMRTIF